MLREAAAMDSNLLGDKIIATNTTRRVTSSVVKRKDGIFMKIKMREMGVEKGEEDEAGDVHFMQEVCRVAWPGLIGKLCSAQNVSISHRAGFWAVKGQNTKVLKDSSIIAFN
jgi:hypothetical protein